ncbi:hypothetical protein [Pseudophaeobacter leonis]|uniref:hypothetical protein n=1 Tax=Pseudophaeobacter leonis TaxID=1144477 RepID=UPI0009F1D8BD|nr:hypothetical protein [Pseudophaeobacter leonis]
MKQMIFALSPVVLLCACNTLQWNSDILGGAPAGVEQTSQGDPGAPLSALTTEELQPSAAFEGSAVTEQAEGATALNTASDTGSDTGTASVAAVSAPGFQGRASTVASLGDPALPGMWMETSLVSTEQVALLRSSNGKEVRVTLKPASGSSSSSGRLSISAMRALGAPLSELVALEVLPAS